MLPAKKTPCNPGSFFGRSYPRALGKLDEDNHLIKGLDVQLPNKPFLRESAVLLTNRPSYRVQIAT